MTTLRSDLIFFLRSMRRTPGYALAVLLTLALGIGAVTAIFSAMDQTLFHKPHPHYGRLVVFGAWTSEVGWIPNAYPVQVEPCMARGTSFEAYAMDAWARGAMGLEGETVGVNLGRVNPDFFGVLGARAGLGRLFLPGDYAAGAEDVVVLDQAFWRETFGGDLGVVGRTVVLEGKACRVVGVVARDFSAPPGLIWTQVYRPLGPSVADPLKPFATPMATLARLRPGATLAQAEAEVAVLCAAPDAPQRLRDRFRQHPLGIRPLAAVDPRTHFTGIHSAFLGAVGFLYAIACLNAVNMMLVRLAGRRRELGIRLALGAPRKAVLRLLATESLALSLLAGLAGLAVAWVLLPAIANILAPPGPEGGPGLHLDLRALAFTLGTSLITALLVALAPVGKLLRTDPQAALKDGDAQGGESPRLRRARESLVVLGAAMALVLLAGTGLMTRSVQRLLKAERGFDPTGKVALWIDLPKPLQTPEARHELAGRLEARVRAVPGVRGVCTAQTLPMEGVSTTRMERPDGTPVVVEIGAVSEGFRASLGLKLLKGRWLPAVDEGGGPVMVVNGDLARQWFGAADPIGRVLAFDDRTWTVIGLVADVRSQVRDAVRPQCYIQPWQDTSRSDVISLLADCTLRPDATLLRQVKAAIHQEEPRAGVRTPLDLEKEALRQIARERFTLLVLQLISGLALVLAILGFFSVMAYSVGLRRREFGIRLALGAHPRLVFRAVLRRGMLLGALGVLLGLAGSWALTRFLRSVLFETSPLDPGVYGSMALVVLVAAALACWIPARRAGRVDPASLLRSE